MTNRFLLLERSLRAAPAGHSGATSKSPACTQFNEIAIDDDAFVLDVLQFFFDERLQPSQLNDELRDIAARVVWSATEMSKAMDLVPRPPDGVPDLSWLVEEAVQIAIRAVQNKCIYEAVRVTAKRNFRSAYEIAKSGVMSMSLGALPGRGDGTLDGPANAPHANLTTSERGIDMIAGFERFSPSPYADAAGDCRIGYGHLLHAGPCTGTEHTGLEATMTEERARQLLVQRVRVVEGSVNRVIPMTAAQHQFDAIVSFAVNVGATTFESSKIASLLSSSRTSDVATELLLWVNGDGMPIPALVRRRKAEAELFISGNYPGDAEMAAAESLGVDLREFETGPRMMQAAAVDWCQIRHNIIRNAVEMQGEWLISGGLMDESHANALPLLTTFWEATGLSHARAEAVARISASDHPTQAFWSAAFISWCVRNAMPDPAPPHNGGFTFHMRHMAYIADAARNRANADATRPFWLFDINDPNVVPEDGDILCLNRSGTSHSFTSVNTEWVTNKPTEVATGSSHTDIVIGHFEDGGRRWIETVGGNVGDTVGSRYYSLDASGRLVDRVTLSGNPLPRPEGPISDVTQTVGSRPPVVFALIRLTACPDFT